MLLNESVMAFTARQRTLLKQRLYRVARIERMHLKLLELRLFDDITHVFTPTQPVSYPNSQLNLIQFSK